MIGTARIDSVAQDRDRDAERRTHQREQQILPQDQPRDARTCRAERESDADLTVPRARPRQHEVGGVAADGEEEDEHDRLQDPERCRQHPLRSARRLPERQHFGLQRRVGFRVDLAELAHHLIELRLRLRDRGPGRQLRHQAVAAHRPIVELARSALDERRHRRRNPDVEVEAQVRALETLGRHPDHGQLLIVDAKRPPDDVRGAAEACVPEVVGNDSDRFGAGTLRFIGSEEAAERRLHAERGKEIAGHELAVDAHRAAGVAERERRHAGGEDLGENRQALAKIAILLPRPARIRPGVGARLDEVKARRIPDAGQRPQHYRLHPREDRGVDADPDAERHDDDGRQHRHASNRPPRVLEVHGYVESLTAAS
jgi:hypothetical protein